jgi:hypothetical protein
MMSFYHFFMLCLSIIFYYFIMDKMLPTTMIIVNITDPITPSPGFMSGITPVAVHELTWELYDYSATGEPISFNSKLWSQVFCVDIRMAYSYLNVKGHKNQQKSEMIDFIISSYNNNNAYQFLNKDAVSNPPTSREEVQCTYCLMNLLFLLHWQQCQSTRY